MKLPPLWAVFALTTLLAAGGQQYRVMSVQADFDRFKQEQSDNEALERWAADERRRLQGEKDRVSQEKIDEAKQKALEFERCIAAGAGCGLRVKVRPATASVSASGGSCVGGAGEQTAELADSARPDHRALRAGILEVEEALKVCLGSK